MTHLNLVIPVILASLLTACIGDGNTIPNDTTTTDQGGRPATVRIGSLGGPDSLNPGVGQLTEANDIFRLVYDSLYQLQSDGSYTLELAERGDVSEDGLGWTFKLRDGITFHDGVPLTAEDVAFTFSLYQNTEDFPLLVDSVSSFASVDALDERTVVLTLNEPVPNLQSKLIELYVLPKHIWSKLEHPADFENLAMIGSGPFKLKEFRQSEFVDLQTVKDHYLNAPKIDEVIFTTFGNPDVLVQALRAGELDMITAMPNTVVGALRNDANVNNGG